MAILFGNVGEFVPSQEEWTQYEDRISHFFTANGIEDDDKKRAVFLSMVGPSTYKLLCNLITLKKPGELLYDQLVQALRKHHNPTPSEIVQRFKFNSIPCEATWRISRYVHRRVASASNFRQQAA
jgi:hypothetical protein